MELLKIVGLLIAMAAVLVLFWSLAKVTYHLSKSVLSIKKNRRATAYLLGPFAFLRPDLFEDKAQPHVAKTARWLGLVVIAVTVVLFTYPFPK